MKSTNKKLKIILILVTLIIAVSLYVYHTKTSIITDEISTTSQIVEEFGDSVKLDEIRERQNVKRQQELIVQEIYLLEEKDRIQTEKEETIKKYDTEIQNIENKLESVRNEKLSF